MKIFFALIIFLIAGNVGLAQRNRIDSLLIRIGNIKEPKKMSPLTHKLDDIAGGSLALVKKGKEDLERAETLGHPADEKHALLMISYAAVSLHDPAVLLDAALRGLRVSRNLNDTAYLSNFLRLAGLSYVLQRDYARSVGYFLQSGQTAMACRDTEGTINAYSNLESSYSSLKKLDSAGFFAKKDIFLAKHLTGSEKWSNLCLALADYGEVLTNRRRPDSALVYYRQAYEMAKRYSSSLNFNTAYFENNMAKTYLEMGRPDSARTYALKAYQLVSATRFWEFTATSAGILSKLYEGNDDKKTLFYLKAKMAADDSVTGSEKTRQFQLIADNERQREQDLRAATTAYQAKARFYGAIIGLGVVAIIVVLLMIAYKRQQTANKLLQNQKNQTEETLQKLKSTQTQLIQSEKMASLGELTAGIAHEIQNPLNFVNNFSEVNTELIGEMKQEINKGDLAEIKAIAFDIEENSKKISMHGKRADAIVKGMLQHSQSGSGVKEPSSINTLADECMRLAYHGLRSKDKTFNAGTVTRFDEKLPLISMIPQDIGRVLLNLFSNAFYAVNQKKLTAGVNYEPEVSVTTLTEKDQVVIKIKDNGTGIPNNIKDKIMQPFFTTKPTGEGTGLGLSLSYDIVVKGHGGRIDVDTKEAGVTEFIVTLPLDWHV